MENKLDLSELKILVKVFDLALKANTTFMKDNRRQIAELLVKLLLI